MITMERVEGAVAIDICEAEAVPSSVQRKHNAVRDELTVADYFNILRVPAHVRQSEKHLHEPLMVAIGPYGRREEPSLRVMEHHKRWYLQDFLSRRNTTIENCKAEIKELEPRARRCYCDPVELTAEKFAEILLLDGCFIIEFLTKLCEGKHPCVWVADCSLPYVLNDLLLLDNQIPLFVLDKLFKIHGTAATPVQRPEIHSLTELFENYLKAMKVESPKEEITSSDEEVEVESHKEEITSSDEEVEDKKFNHLLDFYYSRYITKPQTGPTGCTNCGTILKWLNPIRIFIFLLSYVRSKICGSNTKRLRSTIPSATELLEAGVTIKKKKKKNQNENRPSSFLDVTFCPRHGVLEIPILSVDNSTLPLFSNLVAFEQCGGCKLKVAYMTSYVAFMDCLVNTPEDEAKLRHRGILENNLASDKHLAAFFNQLSEWIVLDSENHYLAELFREVGDYCGFPWHKWRAKLMRDYFSNPWSICSFFAALVILILTFLQTFYSIYSYHHPS